MRQQYTFRRGCPFQNLWIARPGQAHVLEANSTNGRISPDEPSDDVVVEVLVRSETKHAGLLLAFRAPDQPVANADGIEPSFDFTPGRVRLGGPFPHVPFDLVSLMQVEA